MRYLAFLTGSRRRCTEVEPAHRRAGAVARVAADDSGDARGRRRVTKQVTVRAALRGIDAAMRARRRLGRQFWLRTRPRYRFKRLVAALRIIATSLSRRRTVTARVSGVDVSNN